MLPDTVSSHLSSSREHDPHFRSMLTRILHTGLRQCGMIGLIASLLYVGLSVFGLGYELTWTYEAVVDNGARENVVMVGLLFIAALSVIGLILSETSCSLRTGRLFGWGAVVLAAAVATFEGAVRGTFSTEYVILAYVLIVVIVPFRPAQVIGIGGSLAAVVYLLGPSGLAWTGALALPSGMAKHLAFIGGGTVLVTGASMVLSLRHRSLGTARASLRETRDLRRRTQAVTEVGSWEYNPAANTVQGTDELYKILGLPDTSQLRLGRWLQFFPPSARSQVRAALDRCLEDAVPFDQEVPLVTTTDSQLQVRLRGTAKQRDGEVVRVTGILQNVTERQAMEQRIQEQERLLRSITENVSDGIYRLVPGDGLVYANPAFARLFGYDNVADLLALEPEVLYENPRQQSSPLYVGEEADRSEREVAFRRQDGSIFVGLLTGTVVRDENGEVQHVDGVVTDITDLKEREQLLKGERDRFETLFETLLDQDSRPGP